MPVRKELRHFYGREWRTVTRPRILARAGNRCEDCKVPNGALVARVDALPGYWFAMDGTWHDDKGGYLHRGPTLGRYLVVIKLGVAHLNRVPGDDRDENLRALCAHCHGEQSRQTRVTRKDAARPLLAELSAC